MTKPPARQLHSRENLNRVLRNGAGGTRPHVNLSDGTEYSDMDIGARATVVPIREFTINVKHRLIDTDPDLEKISDPINILGPVLHGQIPLVTSNDPASALAAFNKRCNFVYKDGEGFKHGVKPMANSVLEDMRPHAKHLFSPWDENDLDRTRWLNKFTPAKRQRMEEAWLSIPEATMRDIRNKTVMVKLEPLLKRGDSTWGPRAVYVGSDVHNAITGPAMMIAMERLVATTDTDSNGATVAGHHVKFGYKSNDTTLAEHVTRDPLYNVGVECDFSRNDREQCEDVAPLIDKMLEILQLPDWIRNIMLESSEEYEIYIPQSGLKAWLKHQLPTGTTATTFRNSVLNMVIFIVCMRTQNIYSSRCLILGDDLLAALRCAPRIDSWITRITDFRMVGKAFLVKLEGQATFLSRRLFTLVAKPCMVPKLGKALARFNVRASKNEGITDDEYMAGKALSYAYEFRHVPIFSSVFMARFNYHSKRIKSLDMAALPEMSWFTKIAGLDTPAKMIAAVRDEQVLIPEDVLRDWLVDVYLIGLSDFMELFNTVILGTEYCVIDTPLLEELSIDF